MKKMNDQNNTKIVSPLTVWWKRYQLSDRLQGLDDRILDDIGLDRYGIDDMVNATHPYPSVKGLVVRYLNALAESFRKREVAAQLAALDDRLLKDMGIRREDIQNIINGTILPRQGSDDSATAPIASNEVKPFTGTVAEKQDRRPLAA
ncbi:MAG: DUF1127 domain-containing protein [Rhodospirillaceae bacterium]|nr:DUF1127 domain-containing protein [Rhodospirillaceae bacterium]